MKPIKTIKRPPDSGGNTVSSAVYEKALVRMKETDQAKIAAEQRESEVRKENSRINMKAAEFCKKILGQDRNETQGTEGYSWNSLSTEELIDHAVISYEKQSDESKKLMLEMLHTSERRRIDCEAQKDQIFNLQEEIVRLQELNKNPDTPKTIQNEGDCNAISDETRKRIPYAIQSAAENEELDIRQDNSDGKDLSTEFQTTTTYDDGLSAINPVTSKVEFAEEGEECISESELENLINSGLDNRTAHDRKFAPPLLRSKKTEEYIDKEKATHVTVLQNVNVPTTPPNERELSIIQYIGDTGEYERKIICEKSSEYFKSMMPENSNIASSIASIGRSIKQLVHKGYLDENTRSLPGKPNCKCIQLTDIGKSIYRRKNGKDPVLDKFVKTVRDHDNIDHGSGIEEIASLLRESGRFTKVTTERADNTLKINDANGVTEYIPDIIAHPLKTTGTSGFVGKLLYIEYERDTHHLSDFMTKMNKMVKKTTFLNIVTPNQKAAQGILKKSEAWIPTRPELRGKNIKIRIAALSSISRAVKGGTHIKSDNAWDIVFDLNKKEEHIIKNRFSK